MRLVPASADVIILAMPALVWLDDARLRISSRFGLLICVVALLALARLQKINAESWVSFVLVFDSLFFGTSHATPFMWWSIIRFTSSNPVAK